MKIYVDRNDARVLEQHYKVSKILRYKELTPYAREIRNAWKFGLSCCGVNYGGHDDSASHTFIVYPNVEETPKDEELTITEKYARGIDLIFTGLKLILKATYELIKRLIKQG